MLYPQSTVTLKLWIKQALSQPGSTWPVDLRPLAIRRVNHYITGLVQAFLVEFGTTYIYALVCSLHALKDKSCNPMCKKIHQNL